MGSRAIVWIYIQHNNVHRYHSSRTASNRPSMKIIINTRPPDVTRTSRTTPKRISIYLFLRSEVFFEATTITITIMSVPSMGRNIGLDLTEEKSFHISQRLGVCEDRHYRKTWPSLSISPTKKGWNAKSIENGHMDFVDQLTIAFSLTMDAVDKWQKESPASIPFNLSNLLAEQVRSLFVFRTLQTRLVLQIVSFRFWVIETNRNRSSFTPSTIAGSMPRTSSSAFASDFRTKLRDEKIGANCRTWPVAVFCSARRPPIEIKCSRTKANNIASTCAHLIWLIELWV